MLKYFDKYTVAGGIVALVLWMYLAPTNTVAGVIQAIIPAAVPTAFRQGSTGTKFLISNGAFSTNDCVQIDANGNASSAGGACGIAGGGAAFNAITSGTNTAAAMVVGAGASLNFTSTGTINASGVQGTTGVEGNGSKVQLFTGSDPATNNCAKFDANHNIVDAGAACGTGSGGVIGVANFSLTGGTVSNLHTAGVISGITRTNTGRFTVNLSPSQTNFSVALAAGETGGAAIIFIGTGVDFSTSTSSFPAVCLTGNGSSFLDSPQVTVAIMQM